MNVIRSLISVVYFFVASVMITPVIAMDSYTVDDEVLNSPAEKTAYSSAKNVFFYATDQFTENIELIRAVGCLLYIPDIIFADSAKPSLLRSNAAAALVAENIKLLHYLFSKKETRPIIELLWHMPKAVLYSLSAMYEIVRFIDADNVARVNGESAPIVNSNLIKINQGVQLAIEAVLRSFVCINSAQQARVTIESNKNNLSFWLTELADVIELWRLMSRYSSQFKLPRNKAGKKQGQGSCAVRGVPHDLNESSVLGEVADLKNNLLSLIESEDLDLVR